MSDRVLSLLVVDDDVRIREQVKTIWEKSGQVQVIAEADSGVEALRSCRAKRPDLVVMDVHLGDEQPSGIQSALAIRAERGFEELPVVLYSNIASRDYYEEFHESGLFYAYCGYLLRGNFFSADEIVPILQKVFHGECILDPMIRNYFKPRNRLNPWIRLSEKERQVARLLIQGLSNEKIGLKLSYDKTVVSRINGAIYDKLELPGGGEADKMRHTRAVMMLLARQMIRWNEQTGEPEYQRTPDGEWLPWRG